MADESYFPMAYSAKDAYADTYIEAALAQPGKLWLIGNEPELSSTSTTPDEAKAFAVRWQHEVGGEWAGFGVIVGDDGLAWLDAYLAAGGVVGTHWHIHIYWVNLVVGWGHEWRKWQGWMQSRAVVRPTIISETNLYNPATVAESMATLDYMVEEMERNPLLHACIHYSDADYWQLWPWSNLRTEGEVIAPLTELGRHFVKLVTRPEPQPTIPRRVFLPWLLRKDEG